MMQIPYVIISAIFGLVIGSFLNALVYRLGQEEKGLTTGRSMCPHCKHTLSALDLIPVFSYIFLRGKCRYCKKPISIRYPLVELITSLLFAILAWNFWETPVALVVYCFISAGLVAISSFDIQYQLIPYKVSWTLIVVTIISIPLLGLPWVDHVVGMLIIGGYLFLLSKIKIRGQQAGGEGDAEIGLILGGILGLKVGLLCLFIGYILGAVFSIILLSVKKNASGNTRIAFGPFLAISIYIGIIGGGTLLNSYLTLIGWQ